MRILIKWLLGFALLFGLWWALGASGLLPRIPAEQREALALLRAPEPALPGRNATIAAWLMSREVPQAEWARYEALPPEDAQAALAALPAPPDRLGDVPVECRAWGNGCVAKVRADAQAARRVHAAFASRLEAFDSVQRDPAHSAIVGDWNFEAAIPPFNALSPPMRLDAAVRFVDGDAGAAFARLCGHAAWWRQLRRQTDNLIADMVGVAVISGLANSYAEMLALIPADVPPPPACEEAFAPLQDPELDQCRVIRTEFRGLENTLGNNILGATRDGWRGSPGAAFEALTWRIEPTLAHLAPSFALHCETAQQERAAQRAAMPVAAATECDVEHWLFNPTGCRLIHGDIAPRYTDYYDRLLDLDGRLRLVGAAAWLRAEAPVQDLATRFEQRPATLRDERHRFEGTDCAPRLRFEARKPRADAPVWEIPIAPAASCAGADAPPDAGADGARS